MRVSVLYQANIFDPKRIESFECEGEALTVAGCMPEGIDIDSQGVSVSIERWHVDGTPLCLPVVDGSEPLRDGDRLIVSLRPGLEAAVAWQLVFSVATIAASALLTKSLASKLGQKAEDGKENEGYRGFTNSYTPGGVIPIVLGERRIAPPVVGQVVESAFAPWTLSNRETLKLLMAVCVGPIQGFGKATGTVSTHDEFVTVAGGAQTATLAALADLIGLQINDQNASNFTDVIAEWRTGEFQQDPIAGFPDSDEDIEVGQQLNEYSDAIDISDAGKPSGVYTVGNEIDDTLGASLSVTMTDEADRYVLAIFFPQGLYKDSGGGGLAPSTAKLRLQYWPVDGSGTRTGSTVLLSELNISGSESTPQVYYLPGDFYSPTSYQGPSQFGYIACNKDTAYAKVSGPLNPAAFPAAFANPNAVQFSAAAWVRVKDSAAGIRPIFMAQKGSITGAVTFGGSWPYYIAGNSSSDAGFVFAVERGFIQETGFLPWRIVLLTWNGTGSGMFRSDDIGVNPLNQWMHVGVAWNGVTSTFSIYVNGLPLPVFPGGSVKPAFYEESDFNIGHVGTTVSDAYNANVRPLDIADLVVFEGVKPDSWFAFATYNQDINGHTLSQLDPNLDPSTVFASHLSETIAAGKIEQLTFPGSTTAGEVVELVGSPLQAAPQADSPLWTEGSGLQLRGRYHLELFRSNPVSNDPGSEVNVVEWKAVTLIIDEDFEHPGIAMAALSIDADDQVSNAQPKVSMVVRGALVQIWDGINATYPTFSRAWSRNPAWNVLHLLTDEESGLGAVWELARTIDLPAWKVFADYCEEGVEDAAGTPAFFDGDFVASSTSHPYGEVHFKIGILDNTGAATGETLPETWIVGSTVRIKTASDASWLVASADISGSARLTITTIRWESDDSAANGYQHWVQIEADWVSGYTLPNVANVTGTAVGVEDRHQCDALLQERGADGWSAVLEILRSFRAAPVIIGNKLSVFVDRARPVDWFITEAQMLAGTFARRWSGIDDRYNSVQLDFVDRLKDYETDFAAEDHPVVSGDVSPASIRRAPPQTLRAVTRRSEVRRQAIYMLNQWHLLRRSYTFRLPYEGVGISVGDRILIAHDAVRAGFSGRVYADAASATEIKLDRPVTLTFGSTYEVVVRSNSTVDADALEVRETVAIDASEVPGSGSVTIPVGTSITLAGAGFQELLPEQGDPYSFGETGTTTVDARVVRVTFNPADMTRTVDLVEYDADVYADNEFGTLDSDPGGAIPPVGQQGGSIKRPGDNFGHIGGGIPATKEGTRLGADGKPKSSLLVSWPQSFSSGSSNNGTTIWAASVESTRPVTPQIMGTAPPGATSYEFSAERFRPGTRVRVYIQQRDSRGRARPAALCPRVETVIGGRVLTPAAPTVANPKSRQGHAVYSVTFPSGRIPEGVEVRVGGWLLGQKVAAALRDGDLVSPQWVYGADNSEAQGAYTHQVRSLLPNGQVSHAATFTNDDPVPLGAAVESSTAHEDAWASGTLSGLQIDSSYTPPALKFTGSGLEGTFETPTLDLGVAKRWQIEVAAAGHQVHPTVLEDLTEPINSRIYANWLLEGPTGGEDSAMSRVVIEWKPSDTGTPSSTWATFRPGEHYVRSAKFRLRVVRPTAAFDCRVFRFGVRALEIAAFEPGDIDAGTY